MHTWTLLRHAATTYTYANTFRGVCAHIQLYAHANTYALHGNGPTMFLTHKRTHTRKKCDRVSDLISCVRARVHAYMPARFAELDICNHVSSVCMCACVQHLLRIIRQVYSGHSRTEHMRGRDGRKLTIVGVGVSSVGMTPFELMPSRAYAGRSPRGEVCLASNARALPP